MLHSEYDNNFPDHDNLPEGTTNKDAIEGGDKWQAQGRSLNSAAISGLILIGVFYMLMQVVFLVIGVLVSGLGDKILMSANDIASLLSNSMDMFVSPVRWALLLSEFLALLLPTVLLIKWWHTPKVRAYTRLRGASVAEIALAVLGTILIIPIGSFISNAIQEYYHMSSDLENLEAKIFAAHSAMEFLFLVFVVAIAPAICEEFFFRGYIQRTFERTIGAHSIALVGVIFALFHMEPLGLFTLSMIGIWLGYVYYRSKSLLPNMAAHFTNNFVALYVMYRAPVILGVDVQSDQQIPIFWLLATIPLLALVAWAYYKITPHGEQAAA